MKHNQADLIKLVSRAHTLGLSPAKVAMHLDITPPYLWMIRTGAAPMTENVSAKIKVFKRKLKAFEETK